MTSESDCPTVVTSVNRGRLLYGNSPGDPSKSPRCGATSKRTGMPCRAAGIKKPDGEYTRCQFHGGRSTGPKTAEGKLRASHQTHGKYSKVTKEKRRNMREMVKSLTAEIDEMRREFKVSERVRSDEE